MKGHLKKTMDGWLIENENEDLIPLHLQHYNPTSQSNSFTWNDSIYNAGDYVEFENVLVYIEPDSSIHYNRGDTKVYAVIQPEWHRIFEGFTGGLKLVPTTGHYRQMMEYLKENYYPPKLKPKSPNG